MKNLQDGQTWARLQGIMKTLGDPVRLSIVLSTINDSKTYRELMELTHKTKSQVCKHVALLKKVELVQMTRQERQVHIKTTQLATSLLQTFRGIIMQELYLQTDI